MKMCGCVAAALLLSACASQPEDIHATSVSTFNYRDYDCDQLSTEAIRVTNRVVELRKELKKEADTDAVQMGVGLVLFWPTLFFLEGDNSPEAVEYARLKGEIEAIEKVSVQKKCAITIKPSTGLGGN